MKHNVVTIFGGAGFIGRYIVQSLARQGMQIRLVCRRPEEGLRCKPMGDVGQIVPVAANIRNQDSIAAAIEGSDSVINLIGILYKRGPQSFNSIHIDGPLAIAGAASLAFRTMSTTAVLIAQHVIGAKDFARVQGKDGDGEQAGNG